MEGRGIIVSSRNEPSTRREYSLHRGPSNRTVAEACGQELERDARFRDDGELAKRLHPDVLELMPAVDWRAVKAIREVLAHDYEDVEVEVLKDVLVAELPGLREAVESILARADEAS